LVFVFADPEIAIVAGSALRGVGGWGKERSHGRILLARLADRSRSPWKQTSEETMELVFRLSDSPIFPLDLLCPIVTYLKGTILLYESYLRILLVSFIGTARSSSVVRVNGRTVIVLPLPVAWSLALENLLHPIHVRRLGWSAPTVCMACAGGTMSSYVTYI
jgi:hypothetical protein